MRMLLAIGYVVNSINRLGGFLTKMLSFEKVLATIASSGLRFSPSTDNSVLGAQLISLSKRPNLGATLSAPTGHRGGLSAHI